MPASALRGPVDVASQTACCSFQHLSWRNEIAAGIAVEAFVVPVRLPDTDAAAERRFAADADGV